MPARITQEEFIKRCRKVHGNTYDYSKTKYKNKYTKVTITCPIHGDFQQIAESHYAGHGCQKCYTEKIGPRQTWTKEQFLRKAREKFGWKYEYDLSGYKDLQTSIKIIYPEHGEFFQKPYWHLRSEGCSKCGRIKANKSESDSLEDFLKKAKKAHPTGYSFDKVKYEDFKNKVIVTCNKHGDFKIRRANFIAGQGCPKCMLINQMKLLEKLENKFPNIEFNWEYRTNWLGNQRIDIFIPGLKIAIEYDGQQHFVPIEHFGGKVGFEITKTRDKLKEQKCKNNGVLLLRLKYDYNEDDFNNLCNTIRQKYGEDKDKNKQQNI